MCGLAGFTGKSFDGLLEKFLKSILYRGPDENGRSVIENEINLCHSRLSIIDLKTGQQPMKILNHQIIFNGEIYNYLELRKELENKGYKFETQSDTEVILKSYIHYGDSFVSKLNGMFAIAIYDLNLKKLIICNDPFGIKPVYYSIIENELYFSSSAKTITLHPKFKKELNLKALSETIQFRYSVNGEVFFKGINKLKNGEILIWNNKTKVNKIYNYDLENKIYDKKLTADEWLNECYNIFNDSIKINLRADVPIGIFLSSGVDSAGILHFARKNGYKNIEGYSYSTNQQNDETRQVEALSKIYSTKTNFISLNEENFFSNINEINKKFDFPIADSLIFPINELCKIASKKHKVILTGEGADEMFGGYFYLNSIKKLKKLDSLKLNKIIFSLIKILPTNILNKFFDYDENLGELGKYRTLNLIDNFKDYQNTYINSTSLLNNKEMKEFTNLNNFYSDEIKSLDFKYLQQKMINTWLPNQICTKSDQLSMAHGVEARVPFLDKRILNLILNIPEKLLTNGNSSKIIYRNVLKKSKFKNYTQPKKSFYVSVDEKYKESLLKMSNNYLDKKYIQKYNIFKTGFIDHCKYHVNKGEFLSIKRVIMIALIHNWMDQNFN